MCKVFQADISENSQQIHELFSELSQYLLINLQQRFGLGTDADARALVAGWMKDLHKFMPPKGSLTLASVDSEVAGGGCLATIGDEVGHIRHVFVYPRFRRRGIGRKILENLIEQSKRMGHQSIRLDTGWFMEAAQAMYRAVGFIETPPYPETEVPVELRPYWIFMEKDLTV